MTNFGPMRSGPDVNVIRRAYATPGFHRLVPWPVALSTVRVRATRLWRVPALRDHARESMAFVLAGTSRADEVDAAARRWVFETVKRDELTWRPWQTTRLPVEGTEIIRDSTAAGRGVILSFFHHGQYGGVFGSLSRYGILSQVAVLPMFFEPPKPGYDGLRDIRHMATVTTGGAVIFSARHSYAHMLQLLADGQVVAIASDLPGSLPATMLGRRVGLASGAARLARDSGAPIVPVTAWQRGGLQALVVGDPIEPSHHADLAAIQQAIASAHEPALLAWPEGLMEPIERWHVLDEAEAPAFRTAV